tara:strand:- start:104088 stop:105398 length:1311 start_codon:yes stop_codon:yes gene_type:complete
LLEGVALQNQSKLITQNPFSWKLFQLGLFFLPSSALLAGLFVLTASFIAAFKRRDSFWSDKWNYPLVIVAIWMVIGCFRAYSGWLAWVGLANWLPFFWCFWGFQPFLLTSQSRKRAALCLIAGTMPVLITGFGQLWFNWQGPWQLFNGLIIWFVTPGGEPTGRLSGLFDYANIAGAWLALVWPLSLAAFIERSSSLKNRTFAFLIGLGILIALVLTDSRNAWGGLILAIPFVLGTTTWFWLLPLLALFFAPIFLSVVSFVDLELQQLARKIVPDSVWTRLSDIRFMDTRPLESTRLSQWKVALNLILEKPWLGWGAAAFSVLYPMRKGLWHGHAHNLPLDLAVSHGFLVPFLIVGFVLSLLIISYQRGVLTEERKQNKIVRESVFDRAWWTSTFILACLHGADMPFFDSRLNIAGWVLLAGLRSLIMSLKSKQKVL